MAIKIEPTTPPRKTIIDGLHHGGEGGHGGVDLVIVEVGDLAEHCVHGAGLLADADHLHHHRRERPASRLSGSAMVLPSEIAAAV